MIKRRVIRINIIKEKIDGLIAYKAETDDDNFFNISEENFEWYLIKLEMLIELIEETSKRNFGYIIEFHMVTSCFAVVDCESSECIMVDRKVLNSNEIERVRKLLF